MERNLELNSTDRKAVIAVESRDHAKNSGVNPKDQMSKGNKLRADMKPFKKKRQCLCLVAIAMLMFAGTLVSCKKDVIGVTLDKTTLTLEAGKTTTLVATVQPDNVENKSVVWISSNPAVATVTTTGGVVTAISEGTAMITVTTEDGGKTATCNVTVISPLIDTATEKAMVMHFKVDRDVEFEFAGTGTMTLARGSVTDTFRLSDVPLNIQCGSSYCITVMGKNITHVNLINVFWMESIDVSKNINLKVLKVSDMYCRGRLSSLNVSKNTELTELYCSHNTLTSLDVSKNTKLTHLDCSENDLTSLDLSKNTKLIELYCGEGDYRRLDIVSLLESLHSNSILGKTVYYSCFIPIGGGKPIDEEPQWDIARNKGWKVVWH